MLNLTQQERQVILFLTALALIGTGVNFLIKINCPLKIIACLDEGIGRVNLNTADKDLLMSVPGIGEKLAGRIMEYRDKYGGFRSPEELKNIKGITDYKFARIKDSVSIR